MMQFIWLIPALPLLGFLVVSLGKNRIPNKMSGAIASLTVFGSFLISTCLFCTQPEQGTNVELFSWIQSGTLNIPFSFLIDHISTVMLLIITGIGFLIHVYSIGYMSHDEGFARFFGYLNLFIFFMLLLVMGDNYLVMFAGWEGVGLCSYLLIGFWFKNPEYNKAANKAFIMNRIGDLGFLLGILLIYVTFDSISFSTVFPAAKAMGDNQSVIVAITLLLFIGAIGKSAQLPLYTWLPDAMAGPTPVSALIHAATMVTAGIYMVIRSNALYSIAPYTLEIIAVIGTVTAVFAAAIAIAQTDIKKVLAYSTVSQLGYMFAALGAGAYSSSLFHVTTHAFFKALLFLAAGSVIHAMSGEQDIRKMGGLRKKLPITFMVFLIGTLAISGIPPFAGFFSKDEILVSMWLQNKVLFGILALTSVMTAFYMFRLFFLTFFGDFKGSKDQEHHLHESPSIMTLPLIVLAILSTFGGFLGIPEVFSEHHLFHHYLSSLISFPGAFNGMEASHEFEWILMGSSVVILSLVVFATYNRFVKRKDVPPMLEQEMTSSVRWAFNKYYVDEIYDKIIVRPLYSISNLFYKVIDTRFLDGIVNSVSKGVTGSSQVARYIQSGYIGFYIFAMVFGIIAILVFNLFIK